MEVSNFRKHGDIEKGNLDINYSLLHDLTPHIGLEYSNTEDFYDPC